MMRTFLAMAMLLGTFAVPLTAAHADDSASANAPAPAPRTESIPAHTAMRFHLSAPVASNKSLSGTPFTFVLLDPIVVDGTTLATSGTVGSGTLILAGHAGTSGHEGDLTLRLDAIPTIDGRRIAFDNQRLRINGRNKKIVSSALGLIPYAGFGARFIRGADVSIDATTPITTVLDRTASTALPAPSPAPVASPAR